MIPVCCGHSEVLDSNGPLLKLKLILVSDEGGRQSTFEHWHHQSTNGRLCDLARPGPVTARASQQGKRRIRSKLLAEMATDRRLWLKGVKLHTGSSQIVHGGSARDSDCARLWPIHWPVLVQVYHIDPVVRGLAVAPSVMLASRRLLRLTID
jgi:hypothetical protein